LQKSPRRKQGLASWIEADIMLPDTVAEPGWIRTSDPELRRLIL
jgi:hypothetical protein